MATIAEEMDRRRQGLISLPDPAVQPSAGATGTISQQMDALLPRTQSALSQVNAPPSTVTASPDLNFQQRYGRRDASGSLIPIDVSSGMESGPYWRVSQQSDPESKAEVLKKMYPGKNVRILDTGEVALEVLDSQTGKPKDVLINPAGVGPQDLIDLAAQAPEIAAGMAGFLATRGRGALRTVASMIASSFAGGFAGAARDVASRGAEGISMRGGDIARDRGAQTFFDLGAQGALGAIGKASRALSPFAREVSEGSLAFNVQEGSKFLKDNFGIDYTLSPGVRTGSPALLAAEAAEAPLPGARTVMTGIREQNDAAIQKAQAMALGDVSPEEAAGLGAIGELQRKIVVPLENAFSAARDAAIQKGDKRVLDLLDEAIGVPRGTSQVTKSEAGEVTASAFQRRVLRAEEAVGKAYAKVNEIPGGSGDVLSGDAAARAAAEIRKEIPSVIKEVEKGTGLVDEFGREITVTAEERQVLKSGLPEGLEKALTDLEKLKGGKVSLQTLTNMKKAAFDAIAAFRTAHADAKDRWFTKIAGAYEEGIQKGIEEAGTPELKNALGNARDVYKREIVPLERPGLKEFSKGEMDAGMLSPEQVFDRLFEGPRSIMNYQRLKEALGENNVAFRGLKRAWVDSKISKATASAFGTVDPSQLAREIEAMKDRPELARELFGDRFKELAGALEIRKGMEKIGGSNFRLAQEDVRALLSIKDPTTQDFRNLVIMAKQRDQNYVNGILRDVRDGIDLSDFRPMEFISKLRNAETPTPQVREVLGALSTDQRQAIATAELYRLLSEASVREGKTAAKALAGEPVNISPSRLANAFGTGDAKKRTELLLGADLPIPGAPPPRPGELTPNRMEFVRAIVNVLAPTEAASTAFGSLGSLNQGRQIAELTRGPLKYAGGYVKNMVLATAYMGGLGRAVTNRQFDSQASAIAANTLIASEPFLRASAEAFGSENTQAMIAEAKRSIDRYIMEKVFDSPESRERAEADKLLQGQPAAMRVQ